MIKLRLGHSDYYAPVALGMTSISGEGAEEGSRQRQRAYITSSNDSLDDHMSIPLLGTCTVLVVPLWSEACVVFFES